MELLREGEEETQHEEHQEEIIESSEHWWRFGAHLPGWVGGPHWGQRESGECMRHVGDEAIRETLSA